VIEAPPRVGGKAVTSRNLEWAVEGGKPRLKEGRVAWARINTALYLY
jgi:hypothetical protein